MSRLRLLTTTALLLWTSPALPSTIILTVQGTVAPYTWGDHQGFTSTPLIDTAGLFGTPGEALFGDPFTTIWIVDSETRIGTATLTINGGTAFYEANPVNIIQSSTTGRIYVNTTIIPSVRAMNNFTDERPLGIGGSFTHSGLAGYLFPETFTFSAAYPYIAAPPPPPIIHIHMVPGPTIFAGLPGLLAGALLLLLSRRGRRKLLTTPGGRPTIPPG